MAIYIVVLLVLLLNSNNNSRRVFWMQTFFMFLIGFFRASDVGTDVLSYCELVESISPRLGDIEDLAFVYADIEPGFIYLIKGIKNISQEPMFFIRFIFFLYYLNICYSISKLSDNSNFSLFTYYTLAFYFFSFNGIRQAFAVSLVLVIITVLCDKSNYGSSHRVGIYAVSSLLILFVSILFHRSLIICTIIPFIIKYKNHKLFCNKFLIISLCVAMFISIFSSSVIEKFFTLVDFSFLGSDKYMLYMDGLKVDNNFSFVSNTLHGLFAVYLLFTTKCRNIWLVLFSIGTLILVLCSPFSWLFIRVADNFNIFIIFALPAILKEWHSNINYTVYKTITFLYCLVLFFNRLHDDNGDVIPYRCLCF